MQQPLGFVLPPHASKVDGQSGGDDAEADGALLWSLPERHYNQEEAGQHEAHRQQDVHLQRGDARIEHKLQDKASSSFWGTDENVLFRSY